ncbi:hypothetical protein PHYSODRAFT_289081 [Phytophthora sojae]|uniref:RxLR effector protein n=2 Tax=Phytophthora sojae TaxID=67593 RepID=G5AD82_PHYSP|nr:hypothetical protein PHYSODRAFT_289081 [Phytophthora sojae]AEK80630.1 Avh86 [Phytophthora sojae]AEK80631.1 Avh86 [Phytophthora sojae]AEK80632.1 Avh86 [Phytophthora sojae]EGZ06135.1 hypothetical protein PHYSODRAFT_289081 [Phytophthora sojae]|eukprot:XP_009538032.1 hypothetical protein PHYSODRAFT_289081 [Phytophthora sojae]
MRLQFILIVALASLHSSWDVAAAATESKATSTPTSAERFDKRFLRLHMKGDEDEEDDERGLYDAIERALAKTKIPGWLYHKKPG